MRLFTAVLVLVLATSASRAAAQSSLARIVSPIPTTAFDAPDEDLMPLMRSIGDARIVVLGEATHSDGAAGRAKARVARFLHERMGFTVLAWESGFLQSHAMNAALRDLAVPLDSATSFLMAGGWAWDRAIQPLFRHARDSWRTDDPLIMAGFDTGRPHRAAPYFLSMLQQLFDRAPWLRPAEQDWSQLQSLARRGFGFLSSEPTSRAVRDRERAALDRLAARVHGGRDSLRTVLADRELDFIAEALAHLAMSETLKEARGIERAYLRDREMARQLRWIVERQYPGRKVIVWAATAHFTRNSDLITNPADSTHYTVAYEAGNHLAAWFGDDLYTIAFTSYQGEMGEVHPEGSRYQNQTWTIDPTGPRAIETALHGLGHPFAFLDLRTAAASRALDESFISAALGRLENVAPWARVLDAFFFIDRSEPERFIH